MEKTEETPCEIVKDAAGNILVDGNGYVTCESKEGVKFQIKYKEIDFAFDSLQCTIGGQVMLIQLKKPEEITIDDNASQECGERDEINDVRESMKSFSWNDATTKLFLELYKEKKEFLEKRKIRTKKVLWGKIAENMVEHGYNVSAIQIENKLKSLERSYKNMVFNNKKTGRGRMGCPYEAELTELMGHKHNIEPLAISGKEGLKIRSDATNYRNVSTPGPSFINERLAEESFEDLEPEPELEATPSTSAAYFLPPGNVPQHQAETPKSRKKQMGATAKMLESCQKSLHEIAKDVRENKASRTELQKQILAQNKASEEKLTEQLIVANQIQQERNKILKEMVQQMRHTNNSQ